MTTLRGSPCFIYEILNYTLLSASKIIDVLRARVNSKFRSEFCDSPMPPPQPSTHCSSHAPTPLIQERQAYTYNKNLNARLLSKKIIQPIVKFANPNI